MTGAVLAGLCGLATGVLSAWGVGGGTLLLLCMTLFFHLEQEQAQLINLLFFLPAAAAGLFFHRKNGYLDRSVWLRTAPAAAAAALAAALLARHWDPRALRPVFGLFLLWAGAAILWKALRPGGREKKDSSGGS